MNRDLPTINIVVACWFPDGPDGELRQEGLKETASSLYYNLEYEGDLNLVIVPDGQYIQKIPDWNTHQVSLYHDRNGLGASLNQGFQFAFSASPLAMNLADDTVLNTRFDLTPWAKLLLENENVGAVHLSHCYPGTAGQILPLQRGWVVVLDRHNLAAGLRPCLYHKRFFDAYGWFDEGLSAHETERLFNERFCQSKGPESVLALPLPWAEGIGSKVLLGQISPKVAV